MKKIFKLTVSLLLSAFILSNSIFAISATTVNVNNKSINTDSLQIENENKPFSTVSIDENFSDNSLIVIMKNNVSLQFNDYGIEDFPEVDVISIENLAPYTFEAVKYSYEANLIINSNEYRSELLHSLTDISLIKSNTNKTDFISYLCNNDIDTLLNGKINKVSLFSNETKLKELKNMAKSYLEKLVDSYDFLDNYNYSDYHQRLKLTLDTNDKQDIITAINKLEKRNDILCVSPNYYFEYDSVSTNDPYVNQQWYLDRIDYFDALDYADNTEKITVGILDTGINSSHPDLFNNLDFELSKSFVDDEPFTDTKDHGTCIAGIIGASSNNEIGITGICPDVNIVSLKVGVTNPDLEAVSLALDYAEANSIDIVNCSFSHRSYTQAYYEETAEIYGGYSGIIICSSGNENKDIDSYENWYWYPQKLNLDNIICVTAVDNTDQLVSYSNYGNTSVDIAAPGQNIYTTSTNQNEMYRDFQNTSSAAPIVTGVCALIKSIHPDITVSQLKSFIMNNVDSVDNLADKVVSGGIVNANNILENINQKKYNIQYNANSGTGNTMNTSLAYYGVDKKLRDITYSKLDYRFIGWTVHRNSDNKWLFANSNGNTSWYTEGNQPSDYTKFTYDNCDTISNLSNINNDTLTMYAQWEALSLGDVNMDGRISIEDATLLRKYLADLVNFTEQQLRLADVNIDGAISVMDATEIQKIAAGL